MTTKTRDISDLLDANGDVKSTHLDNVPDSTNASALASGTLPDGRLSSNVTQNSATQTLTNKTINASNNTLSNVPNSALTNSSITINGSATSLGGSVTTPQTTINNNADNRLITGSGSANTLEGEANLTFDGTNLNLGDNQNIQIGASNDLQLFHNASDSFVQDAGTGVLKLRGNNKVEINQYSDDEKMAVFNIDGSAELYHNGVKKIETTSGGVDITGAITVNGSALASTTINNNADNRLITGSGSANTLEGESALTFDGTTLVNTGASNTGAFRLQNGTTGSGTNDGLLLEVSGNDVYFNQKESASIFFRTNNADRIKIDSAGSFIPTSNNSVDLGASDAVWRNIYTSDLNMTNEYLDKGNDVDGTKGSWTFQEGSDDLFLLNNKNGKKYKFKLEECK